MPTNINDDGFTVEDINSLLAKIGEEGYSSFTENEIDLIIDALLFYKEMNYI